MNKMKKLLSVVLAVVIALSALSVLGSAARANYKTAANLANDGSGAGLDAYSPYGQVTRLSTEERMSIILDSLDMLLAPMTSLNMGTLVDTMGITVRINLTSVDSICDSIDSFKKSMSGAAWTIASAIVNLGVLEDLSFKNWESGMTRDGTAQLTIIRELLELLHDNAGTIANIVRTGNLDLGLVSSIANINIDLSIIANIPGLIKGLVYPMIERWDDTLGVIKEFDKSIAGTSENFTSVEAVANWRVKKLFDDNMSITTVKYDDKGNMTSEHKGMPIQTTVPGAPSDESPRCVYVVNGTTPGSVMTVYHIVDEKEAKDSGEAVYSYVAEKYTYTLTEEAGNGVYVWKSTDDQGNVTTLKWYNDDSKFLDGFSGNDFDLRTMSLAEILYKFIPPVFKNMAPVVLNGSVKKILAEFLGAKFTYVGQGGPKADDAVLALGNNAFFTEEQGEYLWEWSNYDIIDGVHYYRFEDQIWAGDLSQKNNYFDIINWEYNISDDFMNEFLPKTNEGKGSPEDTLLMNLNNFIIKVADQALLPSAETVDAISGFEATWTRPKLEELKGGNDKLVGTIKAIAQAVIGLAPQHVFGSDWATNERCYVELMLDEDNDVVLTGIAAHLVNMLMPSMSLPGKSDLVASGAKVGAILAAVIREFAAYLAPEYNFDALIYTSFENGTKTFVSGKDSGYWFDVILTMGINVGYEYLRAFADMGEGTDAWDAFVAYSGYGVDGKTYAAGTTQAALNAEWEGMLDYIVDWALEKDYEWTWKMENLVDTTGLTIDLKTAQDPWVKLDKILNDLLPADEILNVTATDCETELEQLLRYDLILALVELRWGDLADLLKVPAGFVRNTNALDQVAGKLKGIVNYLFKKVGGGSYEFIPSAVTDFDSLANQGNLATLVEGLLSALVTAQDRGLLDTALPIVNLFLGWKMDPQAYADPVIYYENPNNLPYIYVADSATVSTTLKVANNASGMLETHRNSNVVDAPYVLTIQSVTCDDSNIKATTSLPAVVQPYGTANIAISGTYSSDKVVRFTVVYTFTGKNGKAIGGEQTMQTYMYISNKTDYNYEVAAHTEGYGGDYLGFKDFVRVQREAFNAIKYGASVKDIVDNFTITFTNTSKEDYPEWVYSNTVSNNPSYVTANQTWVHGCIENPTLKENKTGWMNGDTKENTVNPLAWVDGTDTSEMTSGWVSGNLGSLATVWHNHKAVKKKWGVAVGIDDSGDVKVTINTPDLGEIRIVNTSELTAKADSYANVMASDFDLTTTEAQNAWAAFDTALRNAYTTAKMPYHMSDAAVFTATFSVDAQQALADALDEAYDALKVYSKASGANVEADIPVYVQALEAEIENDFVNGKEINFQDYNFYEYFNYSDVKDAAEEMYRTFLAPEVMDQYYILNSGIREAELNKVIEAETSSIKKAAITASRLENKADAIAESQKIHDEWKMPTTSKLVVDDVAARLVFYKQFLAPNAEPLSYNNKAAHLYFLEKEIAHVEAQNLDPANYTEASWANYAEKLAEAKAVAAGNDPEGFSDYNSRIYDVKYNLMVAYKNLLAKDASLIEAGGIADLLVNIEKAEAIFASLEANDGTWALAEDYEGEPEAAYAQLISALGYYYTGEDGNTWNLYADSAYEYRDNDRPDNQNNQAKVNASNAALEAAIANFVGGETEPNTLLVKEDFEFASDVIIDKEVIGVYLDWYGEDFATEEEIAATGLIYGVEVLDYMLTDALTTTLGDDYLVVTQMEAADGFDSTGAKVEVLDENEDVIETYFFVYFGDLNCDGLIDTGDIPELVGNVATGGDPMPTLAQFIATDINADTLTDTGDIPELVGPVSAGELLPQGELAATFYATYHDSL